MMRGMLTRYREERVSVYQTTLSQPDELGQYSEVTTLAAERWANVQPLGAEAAARIGLAGEAQRMRVRFHPPALLALGDMMHIRDRDWRVIRIESWQDYTACIVEVMT